MVGLRVPGGAHGDVDGGAGAVGAARSALLARLLHGYRLHCFGHCG